MCVWEKESGRLVGVQCSADFILARQPACRVLLTGTCHYFCRDTLLLLLKYLCFRLLIVSFRLQFLIGIRYTHRTQRGTDFLPGIKKCMLTSNFSVIKFKDGNSAYEYDFSAKRNFLAKDVTEIQQNYAQQKEQLRELLAATDEQLERLNQAQKTDVGNLRSIDQHLRQTIDQMSRIRKSKYALDGKLSDIQQSARIDFTAQEAEISEIEVSLEVMTEKLQTMQQDKVTVELEYKNIQAQKKTFDDTVADLREELNEHTAMVNKLLQQQRNSKKLLDDRKNKVTGLENQLKSARTAAEKYMRHRDEAIRLASTETKAKLENWDGEPLKLERKDTRAFLEKRIILESQEYESTKRRGGLAGCTIAGLTAIFEQRKAEFETEKGLVQKHVELIDGLSQDLIDRKKQWQRTLKTSAVEVRKKFDKYMQKRGSAGSVEFNHEHKTLSITFQKDNADESTQTAVVKNLSGGERSFVTFALLLAFGHVVSTVADDRISFSLVLFSLRMHSEWFAIVFVL